jgi:predicted aconitase with swiveling domain
VIDPVAVFRQDNGKLVHICGLHLAPADDNSEFGHSPVPDDYSDETHDWDAEARQFKVSIDRLRIRQWEAVKARKTLAEDSGVTTDQGRVQTDPDSRGKITGMVVMAMLAQSTGAPFEQNFLMENDRPVLVDAGGMIGIGLAAGLHVVNCHAVAQAKRAQIWAATDAAAIEAVGVDDGWPE